MGKLKLNKPTKSINSGVIRVDAPIWGWLIEKGENNGGSESVVSYMTHYNVAGWLSSSIVEKNARKECLAIDRVNEALKMTLNRS